MKNKVILIFSFISIFLFIFFIKQLLFKDSNTEFYQKGWEAYSKKECEMSIFYFNHVNKEKYPDILLPLGACYVETEKFDDAISTIQEALEKKIVKSQDYGNLIGLLGYSYLKTLNLQKARYYLNLAIRNGDVKSKKDLRFIDSLEQVQKNASDISQ